jgi:hypothetical protein
LLTSIAPARLNIQRATLLRLGFPECAPRYLGIAFTDDLRERSVAIHRVWPPETGGPPNAGTSAGRVLDLGPDYTKSVLLKSRSEFGRGHLR